MSQSQTPLYSALIEMTIAPHFSMHVPGHKSGTVFPQIGKQLFKDILSIDMTEITGLDDLHQPEGIIEEAQLLAAEWFKTRASYFLVGGSTSGNLAMILATQKKGRPFLVQRNSHKSIIHALELSGSKPVFLSPHYEEKYERFTGVHKDDIKKALKMHPSISGIILTYPDYYGRTTPLKEIIDLAHSYNVPVLVDEAHGVHFSLNYPLLPKSALSLGADVVVQSAHKMAPAMTMGAYLHINSDRVDPRQITHYLQVFQSSSPSYPILASLDLARHFLANYSKEDLQTSIDWITKLRSSLSNGLLWTLVPLEEGVDDPFKLTLRIVDHIDSQIVASYLEKEGLYPELVDNQHILFTLALTPNYSIYQLKSIFEKVESKLKTKSEFNRATMEEDTSPVFNTVQPNPYSYYELDSMNREFVYWQESIGRVASASVTPYPPGIPLIMKGERIQREHIDRIVELLKKDKHIQTKEPFYEKGMHVYIERE
ncbi:aminotransferase class I/II-fold pyridoxal phosphate-dependent enzyme [Pontibacillus sp. ALD_SL1]|uniref:aminotransferase class I/II-fold pyridoxal phosphate-dependent enzyme n=1 Tax=Pontibacillus sp. ALD_SL1 TaxID=2777185 RepID=UPI001A9630B5|nr:aminotransferase class I/II-fold pyridoxal phosphate-dependent enzyme [Pontibacillus sp. ALD_SL1]QST00108.1 aminotransferase class I/II-fold pyridoxal phosphate-dependent enzyme [Pontibacillus sp. ALD_SL1]